MKAKAPSSKKTVPAARPRRPARAKRARPGDEFCELAGQALARGEYDAIDDATLRRVITAAVKLYAAKMDGLAEDIPIFEENAVNATETVVASCAMIRAAGLNLFDVAMWFRRSAQNL